MKTIAFHLQKGGVGKTSLSVSIAYELSKIDKTIIIDCDPQGNSSSWLLTESPNYELASVLYGKVEITQSIINIRNNLDIIATYGIGGELKTYGENQLANEPFIFCDLVEALGKEGYTYIIFDLSPGMGRLERAVLTACTYVLTPMTAETFGLDGIEIFNNELAKLKKAMRSDVQHTHILINAYSKAIKQHTDILNKINQLQNYKVFTVPVDPVFRKSQSGNMFIQEVQGVDKAKKETIETLEAITRDIINI